MTPATGVVGVMTMRETDSRAESISAADRTTPAGDVDYAIHGIGYAAQRRADPPIGRLLHAALGDARTVLNVGAGAGSYEPIDRYVVAVEPSRAMRRLRGVDRVPAIDAAAEALPFDDASFDAAMATITVHQWHDLARGLGELRRVTRGPIAILTFDSEVADRFWLADYVPELIAVERRRYPSIARIASLLGGFSEVAVVPIPVDCADGFSEAFYARPEAFLDPAVRAAQSAWGFIDAEVVARFVETLRRDLESGRWDARYGDWRRLDRYEGSLRLIVNRPT